MKKVGVLTRSVTTQSGGSGYLLYKEVNDYLLKCGAIPLGFAPPIIDNKLDKKALKKIVKSCDGIILEGGDDFDNVDLEIVKYLYDNDIPTLGICLGMQMMSELFNGKIEKISGHLNKNKYAHFVYLERGSKLFKIIGKRKILVNSRHQYAVLKTNLKKNAHYKNIIEAVSADNKKFFVGVQWHPESLDDVNSYKIFRAFLKSLKKKKN